VLLQEHQDDEAAAAAAQEEAVEAEAARTFVDIEAELGIELGPDDEDEDDEDSEAGSPRDSRNPSEMAPSTSAPVEPKEEERQLSKKVRSPAVVIAQSGSPASGVLLAREQIESKYEKVTVSPQVTHFPG
jgi:hypothetical protein